MNLRQHKRQVQARTAAFVSIRGLLTKTVPWQGTVVEALYGGAAAVRESWRARALPAGEPAYTYPTEDGCSVTVYKVARKKDDVVVLETEDLAAANDAIDKAKRNKKAALYLLG